MILFDIMFGKTSYEVVDIMASRTTIVCLEVQKKVVVLAWGL
jgi:hypothetical protein